MGDAKDYVKGILWDGKRLPSAGYQVGGDHYTSKTIQPWDAMQAWMPEQEFLGYLRGNALKYIARAGTKGNPIEDYRKAKHYLTKLIEVMDQ